MYTLTIRALIFSAKSHHNIKSGKNFAHNTQIEKKMSLVMQEQDETRKLRKTIQAKKYSY